MTRSKKKFAKVNICTGTNIEFYKFKRKENRAKNKQNLRKAIRLNDTDDFIVNREMIKDDWMEPTDGSWLAFKKRRKKRSIK